MEVRFTHDLKYLIQETKKNEKSMNETKAVHEMDGSIGMGCRNRSTRFRFFVNDNRKLFPKVMKPKYFPLLRAGQVGPTRTLANAGSLWLRALRTYFVKEAR